MWSGDSQRVTVQVLDFRKATAQIAGMSLLVALPLTALAGGEAAIDTGKLPPPASLKVDFDRDIKPIFESACYRCHGTERPKSKFSLATRESALKGGSQGVDILPGKSAESPLIHYVAHLVPDMEMPPPRVGITLSTTQIGLLRAWIDQGVNWAALAPGVEGKPQLTASPTLRAISVSGNAGKFRELYWAKEGVYGGLENFQYKQALGQNRSLTINGRAVPVANDFKLDLNLEQKELGFVRFGFEEFRKYYSGSGGYDQTLGVPPFALSRDPYLDLGKVSLDLGLTLPDKPRVVLGYEYDFKHGAEATLEWGQVFDSTGNNPRNVYPAARDVDEKTHVVKLDISHEIRGVVLEDNFRAEFYNLETQRANVDSFQVGKSSPDKTVFVREGESHWQGANAFRAEKQLNNWLFASAGYLFSRLDGSALFNLNTLAAPPAGYDLRDIFWSSHQVLLDQQSHVFNANLLLSPWQGLDFSAGVQPEWRTQHGFGDVDTNQGDPTSPNPNAYIRQHVFLHSDLDTFSTDENFALRYRQIPYTLLYGEARFQQIRMGQYEEQAGGTAPFSHDFLQNTDVSDDLKEYRAGFTISPWSRVALEAYYKRRDKSTGYDHLTDITRVGGATVDDEGYPAFILWRQMLTDEVGSKLILRLAPWLKTTLAYALSTTDYQVTTEPAYGGAVAPGGQLHAGKYDAHTYSLNTTFTPWRRFYLTTTLSLSDTRTLTAQNGITEVIPYAGDTYAVVAGANYILTQTTDFQISYSFSRADFGADQPTAGVPLGMVYDWHGVQAGLTRKFKKNLTARLQYGFASYTEPSSGHFNDFKAHSVFVTLTKIIP